MSGDIYHLRTLRLPENCPVVLTPTPVKDDDALIILKQLLDEARITNQYLSIITHEEISAHELREL